MRATLAGVLALFGPGPALAQEMVGDAAAGEEIFDGQCVGCHIIENEAGEDLTPGRPSTFRQGSRNNLHGIAGRVPASLPDVFYSKLLKSYAESGAVWEEENFVAFVLDPEGFLQQATGMGGPSAMEGGVIADEQQAHDLWAYLSSFPLAEGEGEGQ